ncbi:MAG: phenylacetate-CoA oxygenase, PaaI subunit [Bacteroidetes bacterium]|jgi:ring-1,2-phenylacetyl-CoA epoxidase subunit PaaC|nr:phenylacetate-CoA oxygenase, PaaI subunit [Bacteroidota bacterium]MDF2452602.1 phenylacetate-CoA oxygenase, PaaI subunit [Bacteroidota bacterium]
MTTQEALFQYTLRIADTNLILAQRISEWTGHGPFLEEDLALTNIALDITGVAKSLLEYAASIENKGRSADELAYFRNDRQFYNAQITELPNGDYARTIVRQAIVDCFDYYFYTELAKSKDETLMGIAQKSIKEVTYHLRHTSSWVERFGDGTEESHNRAQQALNELWQYTGELFEMTEVDEILIKEGIAVDLNKVKEKWENHMSELLEKSTLAKPENVFMQTGSRKGIHTEHLAFILAEMQALPRMYPDAKW